MMAERKEEEQKRLREIKGALIKGLSLLLFDRGKEVEKGGGINENTDWNIVNHPVAWQEEGVGGGGTVLLEGNRFYEEREPILRWMRASCVRWSGMNYHHKERWFLNFKSKQDRD
ncbi:hypothetical protein PAMP_016385 [Pampus punctatissimus]